jgi:hypothetical protein
MQHRTAKVFPASNEEDYIRAVVLSESQNLLALASTTQELQILNYPKMTPVNNCLPSRCGELYDVAFGPALVRDNAFQRFHNLKSLIAGRCRHFWFGCILCKFKVL